MRRYLGRATGLRRKPKHPSLWAQNKEPLIWALMVSSCVLVLVVTAIFIFGPRRSSTPEEEGSRPSSGVTLTGSPSPSTSSGQPGTA
jgi:hypothetical protein